MLVMLGFDVCGCVMLFLQCFDVYVFELLLFMVDYCLLLLCLVLVGEVGYGQWQDIYGMLMLFSYMFIGYMGLVLISKIVSVEFYVLMCVQFEWFVVFMLCLMIGSVLVICLMV